jgi:hypothetical protein
MNEKPIEIHRRELCQNVWEKPLSKLAPRYGISDVALKKICKKLNVPTPPIGYWAKIQHGYKMDQIHSPSRLCRFWRMVIILTASCRIISKQK